MERLEDLERLRNLIKKAGQYRELNIGRYSLAVYRQIKLLEIVTFFKYMAEKYDASPMEERKEDNLIEGEIDLTDQGIITYDTVSDTLDISVHLPAFRLDGEDLSQFLGYLGNAEAVWFDPVENDDSLMYFELRFKDFGKEGSVGGYKN